MNWKDELEKAVKIDAVTDPAKLKNIVSPEYVLLDQVARKVTFSIHDEGFMTARKLFSHYWTDMSSKVEEDLENSGYITEIKIEREMSIPFYHMIYVLVTNQGIKINGKYITVSSDGSTVGDDGLDTEYKSIMVIPLEEAQVINTTGNIGSIIDTIMSGFVESYKHFLTNIGKSID